MIAHFLILAVTVLPPEGPFSWKGSEVRITEQVRYFRVFPMKEPVSVRNPEPRFELFTGEDYFGLFRKTRSPDDAFALFQHIAYRETFTNEFAGVAANERQWLLRYAASKGDVRALKYFDEKGELRTGLDYEYVLAQHARFYSHRELVGGLPAVSPFRCAEDPIRPYAADPGLQKLLDQYALTAHWFYQTTNSALPFFEFTPKDCPTNEVPLVVYIPGSGEQGTNLIVQFNQRACLEKVVSPEFQRKHPCRFMIVCLPEKANRNIGRGYPWALDARSELYRDMILTYANNADDPKVDPRRIYLTGLGSGGTIADGLVLDHPGRFAAVAPVWHIPVITLVHPRIPGNWRFYNPKGMINPNDVKLAKLYADTIGAFTNNALSVGGDCSFNEVIDEKIPGRQWWNAVWSGDEMWDWMFSKRSL